MLRDLLPALVIVLASTAILLTVASATHTLVVPRGTAVLLTRWVIAASRALFDLRLRWTRGYADRDRVLAMFAPVTLLALPLVWLSVILAGFAAVYWALGVRPWQNALLDSGSSLLTLGFHQPGGVVTGGLQLIEATLGLGLLALLISFLPSLYTSYSRREILVTALESEAGTPPSATELLERLLQVKGLSLLDAYWHEWTRWFNELEETHSSNPLLVFFRSPSPDRHWVTAAGAVLDSASLVASTFASDDPQPSHAGLCVRAGSLALRRVGDYFHMPYDPDPRPTDPIAVTRAEFDDACRRLAAAGAKLRDDRDQAWRDFAGWRVCYERVLLQFASLTTAPSAPWSADRPIAFHHLPLTRQARNGP
ncbi:hypothetical protein ACFO1B_54280 [Dactylosporangium siamense]|uniref:Two pore domain potassium channel family protein n=1 Tax=Dactylosporangium siamense TaxID=685454 RepID=A0A919PVB4_9ACTN|nr:hypothetical protein [Dactylosporangium siamense]GIG50849.1 hypothetical protein Dsi01nite_088900 [Dactylosporangium siamense]